MSETSRKRYAASQRQLSLKFFLALAILSLLCLILKTLQFIFLPMILAFFIANICDPLVKVFQKWRVPRILAIAFTLTLVVLLLILAVNFVISSLSAFQDGFPRYKSKFDLMTQNFMDLRSRKFNFVTADTLRNVFSGVRISGIVSGLLNQLFSLTGYFFLTIIFILYFLPALPRFPRALQKCFPGDRGRQLGSAVESIGRQVQSYIFAKTLLSMVQGSVTGGVCLFFGVDFAATWAILAFILNFIPTVGPIISVLFPVLIAILQLGWAGALWTFSLLTVLTFALGNFVEPKILGRSVNLNPLTSLLALLVWGWLWGGAGMVVAVPATAFIKFICDNISPLKPLGRLMGNA
ncbi:MAG: AI-2E family transporter [Deltaproteobacteria bacterium]|jgi:predicted PurR-regulated permease PerM|nr:AI-2E family transporter [Deltaproteobacteria bacterium]